MARTELPPRSATVAKSTPPTPAPFHGPCLSRRLTGALLVCSFAYTDVRGASILLLEAERLADTEAWEAGARQGTTWRAQSSAFRTRETQ